MRENDDTRRVEIRGRRAVIADTSGNVTSINQLEYLTRLPKEVPPGRVLVHNHVKPARPLGTNGFRAWLELPNPQKLEPCPCSWAPKLEQHYRVKLAHKR